MGRRVMAAVLLLVLGAAPVAAGDEPFQDGATLAGRVVDKAGDPVPEARLRLVPLATTPPADWKRRVASLWARVRTSKEGRFDLPHVPAGHYRLEAQVRTWFDPIGAVLDDVEPGGEPVEVRFPLDLPELPVRITVEVTTKDGKPVHGGWFSFTGFPQPSTFKHQLTDGHGSAEIDTYPPPGWPIPSLGVHDCKDDEGRPLGAKTVEGLAFRTQTVRIEIETGGVLEGRITIGGKPVHTRLMLEGVRSSFWREVETSGDGHYRFEGLPPGPYKLGFAAGWRSSRIEPIAVIPAGTTHFDHDVPEYATLKGRVVGPPGVEITGLSVALWQRATWGGLSQRTSNRTDDASFEFERVNPGERYMLLVGADAKGDVGLIARAVEARAGGNPVIVTLEAGRNVEGVVVDAAGKTQAHVPVGAYTIAGQRWNDELEDVHHSYAPTDETDEEGRFVLRGVPPGTALLHADTGRWQGQRAWSTGWVRHDAASKEPARLVIRPVQTIEGRVVGPEGSVFGEQWQVKAYAADESDVSVLLASAKVSVDGSFRLEGGIVGPVRLDAYEPWQARTELYATGGPFAPGAKDARLKLERGARLAGRVTDGAGTPVSDAHVCVEGAHWRRTVGCDEQGRFHFRALPPGPYRVQARSWCTDSQVVRVEAGDHGDVALEIGQH